MKPTICPICKKSYTDRPTLSKKDNATLICPRCGVKEAIDSLGVDAKEKEMMLRMWDEGRV